MPARLPVIYLLNDYEAEKKITRKNATTGATEAATGLTGLLAWLSATDGGVTIHASLSKTASERGALGIYFAVFEGDDLNTHLTAGTEVWLVFGDSTNILTSDPVLVAEKPRTR